MFNDTPEGTTHFCEECEYIGWHGEDTPTGTHTCGIDFKALDKKLDELLEPEEDDFVEVEKTAKQLHVWYLEATDQEGSKYNNEAVVPYEDLPEGSKMLDRYIAKKVIDLLHRHEAHVREKWEREIVENLEYRKYNYEDHICRFNDTPQKCECYGKAIDDNISLITKKDV